MRRHSYFSPDVFARKIQNKDSSLAMASSDGTLKVRPTLMARDEAIFWLTAAAEIEHFLMVHYLFAGYSIDPSLVDDTEMRKKAKNLRETLVQIAREEMGHLITVQNLLALIGAPLNFGREHSPYASEIYPYRFKLERASTGSLAKYTMAESPINRTELEAGLTAEDLVLYDTAIRSESMASNDGQLVRHVGPIFSRLRTLFKDGLEDRDFQLERASRQARWSDWGYRRNPHDIEPRELRVLVHRFDHSDSAQARAAAVHAIEEIGEQGEAADQGIGDGESHFERFFEAYKSLAAIEAAGTSPVLPVVANPNVTLGSTDSSGSSVVETVQEAFLEEGRILDPRSRAWAQLFNLRYRLLLRFLQHALISTGPVFVETGLDLGDRTPKGLIIFWTFKEMRRLSKIARKLVRLPSGQPAFSQTAGPPFELPYTQSLPIDEVDRWAGHVDVLRASRVLVAEILGNVEDQNDPFLIYLNDDDEMALVVADAMAAGLDMPSDANPGAFRKVTSILDEAVRGFPVGVHGGFWRDVTLETFLTKDVFSNPPVIEFDADRSQLFERVNLPEENLDRMPRNRPRIDQTRIDFIRAWIEAGAPDSDPAGQVGLQSEPEPNPESVASRPAPKEMPGFEADIKPLFRETPDRISMLFMFDLHSYEDVRNNATEILSSLESGRMPRTVAWSHDRIELFRAWIVADFPP